MDFRGLTVEADTKLRNEFRASGCEYQVVKNTLLGLAVKGTGMEVVDHLLAGPTGVAYSFEDPAVPAKIAAKVAKEQEKFVIKGGYVDGKALDKSGVEALVDPAGQGRAAGDAACDLPGRASELPRAAQSPRPRTSCTSWLLGRSKLKAAAVRRTE